ncbi:MULTISPECIES: glycosyltransferase family 2 protein [Pseudoalteromonas]|uniref:glycosyltransferase family 2 protein n=1 Tax=Pseudoalteromonas TaxID=53246 RepID=UPI0015FFD073|nr:glycosyltransferase [Pseudoalteromonas sp. SG43-3]MBB1442443.1 glycosyltransferase [Pseudoalteromonas sp. SG43-3]
MWFKKKSIKASESKNNDSERVEEDHKPSDIEPDSSFRYWIDICGFVKNKQLLIRGWAIESENEVVISLLGEDKIPAYLKGKVQEDRDDVLSHLNLKSRNLAPGFFQLYDCELLSGPLYLNLKSSEHEITLPLELIEISDEKLTSTYDEFLRLESDFDIKLDVDEVELETYDEELISDIVEPKKDTEIVHYIERVGTFNNKFVVIKGWVADAINDFEVMFSVKLENTPLRIIKCIKRERFDVAKSLELINTQEKHGFLLIVELAAPTKQQLELGFESTISTKTVKLDISQVLDHKEVEGKLLDTNSFNLIEARKWLIENLGASYFTEIKKEFVNLNEISTNIMVESAINCGESGIFIRGWIDNHLDTLSAICVSDGAKISENLLPLLCRKIRTDVNEAFGHLSNNYKSGFYCYSLIKSESKELAILLFEKSGEIVRIPLSVININDNEIMATQNVLVDVEPTQNNAFESYQKHIMPALHGIWGDRVKKPNTDSIKIYDYGTTPEAPRCSIIVPLYGRYDFVLHQISQFEKDATLEDIELIYVLDDPTIEQPLLSLCEDVSKLYSVPFKVISCGRNLGFSGANNLGVSQAIGDKLLLLNSDVIPSESGWLDRMLSVYDSTDNIGAMGVKLVYEDETIQHIGMQFRQSREFGGIWLNEHQYKGMPANLVPKFEITKSDTVTAACLLIDKQKFEEVEGFETRYILGDFEDSDLCLKLIELGYENYVLGSEKLYHLERQSQSLVDKGDWKFKLTLFNGWQHTVRWNNMINELREKNV